MTRKEFKLFYEGTVCKLADALMEKNKDISFVDNFGGLYEEYLNQKTLLIANIYFLLEAYHKLSYSSSKKNSNN